MYGADVLDSLLAALEAKRMADENGEVEVTQDSAQYVLTIQGTAEVVKEHCVNAMVTLRTLRSNLRKVDRDRSWQKDERVWRDESVRLHVPFLVEYAKECSSNAEGDLSVSRMREVASAALDTLTLGTQLRSRSEDAVSVSVAEAIGGIGGDSWLNDTTVFLALRMLQTRYPDVVVMESLAHDKLKAPDPRVQDQHLVVFPLNYDYAHWCVVLVLFDWAEGRQHSAFVYEPMCREGWNNRLEKSWTSWIMPVLSAWQERDGIANINQRTITRTRVLAPRQTDGSSCGVLCLVQGLAYMSGDYTIQELKTLPAADIKIMRLRLLYMFVLKARRSTDESAQRFGDNAITRFGSYGISYPSGRSRK